MTETVTRIRAGAPTGVDKFKQPVPGPATQTPIEGALFDPGGSSEPVEAGRTPVVTKPTLYFRGANPDIVATDQVSVRGVVYDVDGDPAYWDQGDPTVRGLVVALRNVKG